jgi:hypothetical protein
MRRLLCLLALFTFGVACGSKPEAPPAKRTAEEQRAVDSTIGASALPGSQGVRGALAATDSAAARQRVLDSIARNP